MTAPGPAIIPCPTSMETGPDPFVLTPETIISCDPGAEDCAQLLADYLQVTGLPLPVSTGRSQRGIDLRLIDGEPGLGLEGYRLGAGADGVTISAATSAGLRHGIQTLRQLLPTDVYAQDLRPGTEWRVAGVQITDAPRLAWRGSLLDVGRWFLPMDYLKRYVESLAVHKMNRFHLHLTEDQGWRFQVNAYPKLTEVGACRSESQLGPEFEPRYDGKPHGGFYTQDELRELVAFAHRRGIVIVPEIDMPGHVTAAIAAYPELGNCPDPRPVSRSWGVHTSVLNLEQSTLHFFQDVLDELLEVFPSEWIHIGGDECPTVEWMASPVVRARMRELGLSDATAVQEWFVNHMCSYLREKGRTPIVWDEAATDGLDRAAIVMAWRHEHLGIQAAERGYQVVMSPMQTTYFDWYQSDEPGQPVAHPGGVTTLRDVFGYDPNPPSYDSAVRERIIGTQAQVWGEFLPTPQRVDDMAFPRLCALAERAWSPPDSAYSDFLERLATHSRRLIAAGVSPRPLA